MLNKFFSDTSQNIKLKKGLWVTVSVVNGVFYAMTISQAGAENVWQAWNVEGEEVDVATVILCAGAGLCCATFYYKTFQSMDLYHPTYVQLMIALLAPFSGLGFLSGGVEGGSDFFTSEQAAIIGAMLYGFRILTCVDASFKLPGRLNEMRTSWVSATTEKNYAEISRLMATGIFSFGYAFASMDAIYTATQIVSGWMKISKNSATIFSYCSAVLGAIGIFPLILYWTHRGLKQLTKGGVVNSEGVNPDRTDRYTFLALFLVLPNFVGIVGASVGGNSNMLGFLGIFGEIMRLSSSLVYTAASGTPGISTLLRAFFKPAVKPDDSMGTQLVNPLLLSSLKNDSTPLYSSFENTKK